MMLVLSRKTNQQIIVGEDIIISIVRIDHDQVKVGIEAPREVAIDRMEVRIDKNTNGRRDSNVYGA